MKKTKSVFLCAFLAIVAFMPVKNNDVFANKKAGVIVDVVEENNALFDREVIWKPGHIEESSINISNNLDKAIKIKKLSFHDESIFDYLNSENIDESDERYKHFLENATIVVKDNKDIIFEGSLEDVFLKRNIKLEKEIIVQANESKSMELEINISEDLDNRGQGIQHEFSVSMHYEYEDGSNNGSGDLPNTGGFSNKGFMILGIFALGIGLAVLKLPKKREEI
ncbi:LPXTG cell wall anchor domain-containing protein [Clostridium perfringens]|nr:LPXTG cell wall anchor domain-containing protein [Clostridium perfringens]